MKQYAMTATDAGDVLIASTTERWPFMRRLMYNADIVNT